MKQSSIIAFWKLFLLLQDDGGRIPCSTRGLSALGSAWWFFAKALQSPGTSQQCPQALETAWKQNRRLSDLKLSYHMYFLCKDKVPIANPSQQATDLFPRDPSETNNHQETAMKRRSSTRMVRDRAAERSNGLSLSCTSYSHSLKTCPVRRNFITALTY